MRKSTILIIVLSSFSLAMSPPPSKPASIKGKVTDSKTYRAVAQAQIKLLSLNNEQKASTLTDNKGNYELRNINLPRYGGVFKVVASKEGYASKTSVNYLAPGKKYTLNFRLNPVAMPNRQPQITSITPEDGTYFLAGAAIPIKITATDPDKDSLQYQFSVGGTVKRPWSSIDTFIWQTSSADTGAVEIKCEAKDPKGLTASRTISVQIINPSIDAILHKVVDNYELIEDQKMDIVMTSKFSTETAPFGEPVYTRQYFKRPDKQRTETFSEPTRQQGSMTEIHIVNGFDSYLIDPLSGAKAHMNMLNDQGLTQEQLYQMDEVYHLSDFLAAHAITRVDVPEDLANGLVTLEIVPKVNYLPYSKLVFQIDYFKGIKAKDLIYVKKDNEDKLIQQIITTASQKMPNGAWLPAAEKKTSYFDVGNLTTTHTFSNIEINTNLPDDLFKVPAE